MSEYGIKIKNIEAGTLYEYNLGVRDHYEYKNAMFTNSLFSDFIITHGLKMWGSESTRDIICIEFNFGSRSYEDEVKHLQKLIKQTNEVIAYLENPEEDFSYLNEKDKKKKDKEIQRVLKYLKEHKNSTVEYEKCKLDKLNDIMETAKLNADRYCKKSKEEIREEYYENGVDVEYIVRDKNGNIKDREVIHYKMLYRTPGKAKKGSCMFINEDLYDEAIDFLRMGIKLPEKNSPIIEIGAYSSLITSTIVGRININPENILILNDVDSFFETKVVSVETDEDKHCIAKTIDNYKLKNTLFDGQALIEHSIFPEWGDGYILLRQHFCKMAAFDCHIQRFFKDYYGDKYENAIVKDMFGNDHYVKDIELITTDNAVKFLKFEGITYEYWCDKVRENGSLFGIVKTAHKSKLGDVQKMSYQMVNALDIDAMDEITRNSVEYVESLKKDNKVFLEYLKKNSNFSNDFEVLVALCEHNPEFVRCDYFRDRKKKIIQTYVLNLKTGKVIQNGDNLVIVGSPYAMLLHAVGEDVNKDDTFCREDGTIQCYTGRFENGEYLAAFRNPFNSRNNLTYLHNVSNDKLLRYFEFGEQIIAVNMIGTDFQDRNNGSDQDSDSLYTTNQKDIVRCAKEYYKNYPTIVNKIPMQKNTYDNSLKNFALIDNKLAASQLTIGESSNLAQICLSYSYNFKDKKYQDYVCILSVLAQIAIDNAKRSFDIDLSSEISRIKKDMEVSKYKYPLFWQGIRKGFNKDRINSNLKCPMNSLYNANINKFKNPNNTIPISEFFIKHEFDADKNRKKSKKVEELIQKYSLRLYRECQNSNNDYAEEDDDYLLLRNDFDDLLNSIRQTYISSNYLPLMSYLINRAFNIGAGIKRNLKITESNTNNNKSILLKTLYEINKDVFLKCFKDVLNI